MFEHHSHAIRSQLLRKWSIGIRLVGLLSILLGLLNLSLIAEDGESRLTKLASHFDRPALVASWQDDVQFHDVQCLGKQRIWCVGDHGTIWSSQDAGEAWSIIPCPTDAALHSVHFLTDRVGWVAGGYIEPHTQLGIGVIFFTQDGGESWHEISQGSLPLITSIRFFTMQQGIAVGKSNAEHPTGVLLTSDGGQSWHDAPGPEASGWQTADFLNPDAGVVAGLRGQVALVGEGRLMQPQLGRFGLRGVRAAQLLADETGWMVGDGGLVLYTDDGGVVWREPPAQLPDEAIENMNFRAVAGRDKHLWIAGSPGSAIWHSPDAGQTWERQFTKQTVPISSLAFSDAEHGYAAGALGTVLRTQDGGQTWTAVRGGDRRAAIMQFGGKQDEISLSLIAKFSGELGYRSVSVLPIRRDYDPQAPSGDTLEHRLQQAVITAGGNGSELGWQFPVDAPDLERKRTHLAEAWNIHTEGKLDQVLMQSLVGSIRTWRPNIVVISQPTDASAGTRVLHEALLRAVPHAADPTYLIDQQEVTGLSAWRVDYVYQREPEPNTGHDRLEMGDLLPRWGKTLGLASAPARSLLSSPQIRFVSQPDSESFRVIYRSSESPGARETGGRFFAGIDLAPGSSARRRIPNPDDANLVQQQQQAKQQRNFHAISKRMFDDPRQAAQALAQVRTIMAQWTEEAAVAQLDQLATEYGRRHQWDLVEATYVELVQRYPNHLLAADAMKWLISFWSSTETAWQRSRKTAVTQVKYTVESDQLLGQIERAYQASKVSPRRREELVPPTDPTAGDDAPRVTGEMIDEQMGTLKIGSRDEWRTSTVQNWQMQAVKLAHLMHRVHPELYRSTDVQFSLAALMREHGQAGMADVLYRRQRHRSALDPLDGTRIEADLDLDGVAAAGEIWLVQPSSLPPKAVYSCSQLATRPELDGRLADECWQTAREVYLAEANDETLQPLEQQNQQTGDETLVFLAYDQEYLYLAANVRCRPELPDDPPLYPGRLRDTNLHEYDRLSFYLDIDRDFATAYELHVDQRGWTAEACAGDRMWDPTWYVAAERDDGRWRIECAIPWSELTPTPPLSGQVWNLRVVRTMPAYGMEFWPEIKKSAQPRSAMNYGFLRFE
ncbi:MAG: YCF48-related protein [Planctomycetaceae bacterium]